MDRARRGRVFVNEIKVAGRRSGVAAGQVDCRGGIGSMATIVGVGGVRGQVQRRGGLAHVKVAATGMLRRGAARTGRDSGVFVAVRAGARRSGI